MTQARPVRKHVTIIGLGLIGSSIARVLHKGQDKGRAHDNDLIGESGQRKGEAAFHYSVKGYDKSEAIRTRARKLSIMDEVADNLPDAIRGSEIIILAVPVGAMKMVSEQLALLLEKRTIITDVGSSKALLIENVQEALSGHDFVPAHPVAGTEESGPEAGFATLFRDRWCILTPRPSVSEAAIETVAHMWTDMGAKVERMDAVHHDMVLAVTSHLPHLIAYTIVGTASDMEEVTKSEVIKYSAGGFRDFTRIAASDPIMWRDIFLNNKTAVLEVLQRFSEDLSQLQRAIRWDDGDALFQLFSRTRAIRRAVIEEGQDDARADFGRQHD